MKDTPGMTVRKHHLLCVGALGLCYYFVPEKLQGAIREAVSAAQQMGMGVDPVNLEKGLPLMTNDDN